HDGGQRRGVVREYRPPVLLQPAKEARVAKQTELGGLDIARAKLAGRQCRQQAGIGQHQAWLMEGADQVFALGGVDGGLDAWRPRRLRALSSGSRWRWATFSSVTTTHLAAPSRESISSAARDSRHGPISTS